MSRFLVVLGALVVVLAVLGTLIGLLAYGTTPTRSGRIDLAGLQQPASVSWEEDGAVLVEAANEPDLMAALGYAHAADHAWAMALWRQTAEGRLASWFGPSWRGFDEHARLLSFDALARQTYARLDSEQQALLDAYAHGVNRAFAEAAVAQSNEFVLLDVEPDAWAPWHALTIERMIAWMGTPSLDASAIATDSTFRNFARTDSLYRALLRLDGASQSRSWTARLDSSGMTSVQQIAYGATALPFIQPVTLRQSGRSVLAATIPGTLMTPAGQDGDRTWTIFLTAQTQTRPVLGAPPHPVHDRLVDRDGGETLLTIYRDSTSLYVRGATASTARVRTDTLAADSSAVGSIRNDSLTAAPLQLEPQGVAIVWTGFAPGTDLGAWRALRAGADTLAFRLFRGDGLVAQRGGSATVLGSPPVQQPLPGGVYVAADSLAAHAARYLAERLSPSDSVATSLLDPGRLAHDAFSPWAARRVPGLLTALGNRDSLAMDLKDPYAYMLSWDARYDPDAIGASVFETWMDAHESITGAPPTLADSVNRPLLHQTLRLAVAILRDKHGDRPSGWRWAQVRPGTLYVPMADSAGATGGLPSSRYAAHTPARGGHPTALQVGPSLILNEAPAPAVWTAWTTPNWDGLHVSTSAAPDGPMLDGAVTAPTMLLRRDLTPTSPLTLRPPSE